MTNLNKKNAIYIEGVVIANGITDGYGDVLNKEDINKLMTSFVDKTVDKKHSLLEEHGVSIIKNYTTEKAKRIHGRDVPVGSWVSDLMIWNEDLIQDVYNHEFNGLSLASVPNKIEDIKAFFGEEPPNYRDFMDKDDLTPLTISLVKTAGNGYDFDIYPYDVYIKRDMENKKMTETQSNDTDMAQLAKEMLSIIARSAKEPEPTVNRKGFEEKFDEIDERIGTFEDTIDKKLDEKLEVFLSKLQQNGVKKEEEKEGDAPVDEGDKEEDKDEKDTTGKKGAGKGKKGAKKEEEKEEDAPIIKRHAPQTKGMENYTGSMDNPTFEGEAPRTKRDMFGRPVRA